VDDVVSAPSGGSHKQKHKGQEKYLKEKKEKLYRYCTGNGTYKYYSLSEEIEIV
jgi:hypothetical protein